MSEIISVQRSVRIDRDLWREAKSKADREGRFISEVVAELLKGWLKRG
jgi:hypothetical protein